MNLFEEKRMAMRILAFVAIVSCSISGILCIVYPKPTTAWDGAAWIMLGLYSFAAAWSSSERY